MKLPLTRRRDRLEALLADTSPAIRLSSTLPGSPSKLVPLIREQGLEGIVAKDVRSPYEPGKRTGKWQKFKLNLEEEFLIGGYIPSGNGGVDRWCSENRVGRYSHTSPAWMYVCR